MNCAPNEASSLATRRSHDERDREPAADRGAVHRGDHRLRQLVDRQHQLRQVLLDEVDRRRPGRGPAASGGVIVVAGHVGAGAEALAAPA